MIVISIIIDLTIDFTSMKVNQAAAASPTVLAEAARVGKALARLRISRRIQQSEAATRAGLSRNTAYRIEKGDPGVALGQWLRYLDAIAPETTLLELLSGTDPSLKAQAARERSRRVRSLTDNELKDLDF
ncbi:helix-turn-helix transcriptional regulator [Burkholderia sp. BCCIQ04A]|uniref:Helix-turn-helix transcriptional regulator n=1 Tax=Burkholderia anthinoferrum TaxID=3090833 RepID=A0ABU5WNT9_9BURK|nr:MULTISPECIES: helix-turn-helix transcriptional regulator [Burkholderia]MEB2505362.1 helix-turn-helix transcriptional regulator [Burkholderia anthinoferrum]MEB2531627.1 helix-turn-helix transcriptional regulator [Burkholderia anthinoferrum]MEB2565111.1 helix-turn-helix transcriptional regulator [Burkholderia anthinoferrum]MEB2580008.1 helix-turn-helix transcriptional regulator [Burkholderia anthinoferrum]MCA8106420.1 helix-turn-helix domain-containing protein [Burkholderia sp. AU36459]